MSVKVCHNENIIHRRIGYETDDKENQVRMLPKLTRVWQLTITNNGAHEVPDVVVRFRLCYVASWIHGEQPA